MNEISRKSQVFGAWFGLLTVVVFFAGITVFMRILPPPISPETSSADLIAFYGANRPMFLFGTVCAMMAGGFLVPFAGSIAVQLKKIEGGSSVWTYTFLMAAAMVAIEIIIPAWMFATLGFRSRPPDLTLALSDMAWLMFVWPNSVTMIMAGAVGMAILQDDGVVKIYPRWVGFFSIGVVLFCIPSNLLVLFSRGPIAWNGFISFWIVAVEFGSWLLIMFFATRRAALIDRPAVALR